MTEEQWVHVGAKLPLREPDQTFGQYLLQQVRGHGEKTVLIDGATGETVSGAQLLARSVAVALELRARGVQPGDVVSAGVDNCLEVAYVLLGAMYMGAVYAPFNPNLHEDDVRLVMAMLQPRLALCAARCVERVRAALPPGAQAVQWDAFLRAAPALDAAAAADFLPHASGHVDDTLFVACSSGTTGPPKGVMHSHRTMHYFCQLVWFANTGKSSEDPAKDVTIQAVTNFWMSGFVLNIVNAVTGIPMVICKKFDVDTILGTIEKYKVTNMLLPPSLVAAIAKHPDAEKYDVSSLKDFVFGGAALSPALWAVAQKRLGKVIVQYYGQTECLQGIFPDPMSPKKPESVGKVAPNAKAKIVDIETGKAVGPNTEGEICLKSKLVFSGYYKDPKATIDTIDVDGWLHTGDVGYFDEEGYFYVCDRYKELIKYKGTHIAPAEVENALVAHEGVRDAAVVGIEHDDDQEHPVGFVVRQEGHAVTAQELVQLVREQLPVYKQLHGGVYFVEEIPRTASGKIQRRLLRQQARTLRNTT